MSATSGEYVRWGVRPSNGTCGDIQRSWTCDICTVDHDGGWHDGEDDGNSCPIIMDALAGVYSYPNPEGPPQWGYVEATGAWLCSSFVGPCSCDTRTPGEVEWCAGRLAVAHAPTPMVEGLCPACGEISTVHSGASRTEDDG